MIRRGFSIDFLISQDAQYIYQDSKLKASLVYLYICFLPDWSGTEIKCTMHVDLSKLLCEFSTQKVADFCPKTRSCSSRKEVLS